MVPVENKSSNARNARNPTSLHLTGKHLHFVGERRGPQPRSGSHGLPIFGPMLVGLAALSKLPNTTLEKIRCFPAQPQIPKLQTLNPKP